MIETKIKIKIQFDIFIDFVPALAPELSTALDDFNGCRRGHKEVLGVGGTQLIITVQSAHDPVVIGDTLK
jgi:hypothetical protein